MTHFQPSKFKVEDPDQKVASLAPRIKVEPPSEEDSTNLDSTPYLDDGRSTETQLSGLQRLKEEEDVTSELPRTNRDIKSHISGQLTLTEPLQTNTWTSYSHKRFLPEEQKSTTQLLSHETHHASHQQYMTGGPASKKRFSYTSSTPPETLQTQSSFCSTLQKPPGHGPLLKASGHLFTATRQSKHQMDYFDSLNDELKDETLDDDEDLRSVRHHLEKWAEQGSLSAKDIKAIEEMKAGIELYLERPLWNEFDRPKVLGMVQTLRSGQEIILVERTNQTNRECTTSRPSEGL